MIASLDCSIINSRGTFIFCEMLFLSVADEGELVCGLSKMLPLRDLHIISSDTGIPILYGSASKSQENILGI